MIQNIVEAVEKYRELIFEAEKYLWANPETGYKEWKTSKYMEDRFEEMGYTLTKAKDITGFYTQIDTGRAGPEVLILAELDSVICPTHKDADPTTGAVHACGHHAQCATLLGIAGALKDEKVLSALCGKIRLCAVPAEELLEMEYRTALMKEGKIKYYGGKSEFLSRGYFDGVDMAFMVHTTSNGFKSDLGMIGVVAKKVIYKGVASHAGGAPWEGKNALYAATCGLNAVNALRETFRESGLVRWHPIITHGGDMVNAIPETVRIESYVRGGDFQTLEHENKKINQALIGSALSFGVNIEIIDEPGYAPLHNATGLLAIAKEAYQILEPDKPFTENHEYDTGSTDMGDLSCIMPVVHPYAAGACGTSHGNDYRIYDVEQACVTSAKWQLVMLTLLLQDGAIRAKNIIENYKPRFASKEEFLARQDSIRSSGERIEYRADGSVELKL